MKYPGPTVERTRKPDIGPVFNKDGRLQHYRSFEWPLAYYETAKHITRMQAIAGGKFYHIWRQGCLKTRFAQIKYDERFDGIIDYEKLPATWEEYKDAVRALRTKQRQLTVYSVCCLGHMAGRGNMVTLREALDDLSNHFGLTVPEPRL